MDQVSSPILSDFMTKMVQPSETYEIFKFDPILSGPIPKTDPVPSASGRLVLGFALLGCLVAGLGASIKALKRNMFKNKDDDVDVAAPAPAPAIEPRVKMVKGLESLEIPLEEIKSATGNFNEANLIGKGGFGKVYKGKLTHHSGNTIVAVKRLDSDSEQGQHEFMTEISTLINCRHPNLISLIGYYKGDSEMILIYEYAQHGSLDKVLREQTRIRCLTWEDRLNIAIGAASGLNYLHTDVGPKHRIIHRDVKSANILLGDNWEAKISDFGLSKVGPANQACSFIMSKVAGTPGYCDPEYLETGILTKESDVYSFGVLLFELLSGRPAMIQGQNGEVRSLVHLVHHCFREENLDDVVDPFALTRTKYHCVSLTGSKEVPSVQYVPHMSSFISALYRQHTSLGTGDVPKFYLNLQHSLLAEDKRNHTTRAAMHN